MRTRHPQGDGVQRVGAEDQGVHEGASVDFDFEFGSLCRAEDAVLRSPRAFRLVQDSVRGRVYARPFGSDVDLRRDVAVLVYFVAEIEGDLDLLIPVEVSRHSVGAGRLGDDADVRLVRVLRAFGFSAASVGAVVPEGFQADDPVCHDGALLRLQGLGQGVGEFEFEIRVVLGKLEPDAFGPDQPPVGHFELAAMDVAGLHSGGKDDARGLEHDRRGRDVGLEGRDGLDLVYVFDGGFRHGPFHGHQPVHQEYAFAGRDAAGFIFTVPECGLWPSADTRQAYRPAGMSENSASPAASVLAL